MELVFWCNVCQSAPSQGKLTGIYDGMDEPVTLDACENCAKKAFNIT